ncbi:MAG: CoB--CoM heterodisulfide reductase iron-sulfur subunit A family protein [Chloroflexota bacterium]|nr:CoB--CoM heterodisulfide reductase iron-sulfur subunit A family protein [Chloroflexota bacterium]
MENDRRIGVYICHCGTNIAGTVDIEELTEYARHLPGVVVVRDYKFVCSEPGQNLIKEDIRELGLNRVVVAACSPRMHEPTFRRAVAQAGLNPYLLQIANIREQCSWVHEDGNTDKAKALVNAAAQKAYYLEPRDTREVPVNPSVLVIGGGIAGIQAALKIADATHKVYLVEREPSIGGRMIQLDKTFPTLDCSSCILTPKMASVASHPFVELMTYSEVVDVSGYVGNFRVKIRRNPRYVDESICTGCGICIQKCPWKTDSEFDMGLGKRKAIYTPFPQAVPNIPVIDTETCVYFKKGTCRACELFCEPKAIDFQQTERFEEIEVGAIIVATGYDVFDPSPIYQYGYKRLDNVVTSLEFERMCSATGPTGGEVVLKSGEAPTSVAIIHCVGSRDQNYFEYCSRVCCMYALKFAHLVKEKTEADVYQIYMDMRAYGKGFEEFYRRVSDEGVNFVRGKVAEITDQALTDEERGKLIVACEDTLLGRLVRIPVDMVVLCPAMKARADAAEMARLMNISRGADGFFLERHPKLEPISTNTDGVFVVGCAQGPKDIPDTVAQASAGAAEALALIDAGKVEVEAITAAVNEELCSGCKVCIGLCPYNAITFSEEKKVVEISDVLCKGCGVCVAACPAGAIIGRHFTDTQIFAEIEGILADARPPVAAI